jgi:putative transposase
LTSDTHEIVGMLVDKNLSERRACGVLQIARNTQRYEKREDPVNEIIREEIRQVARRHRRYGTPRVTWLLRRNGYTVNHKRVERLYALEGLQIPRKRGRKKYVPTGWCRPYEATRSNEIWAMDFVFDKTKHGVKMKFLNVIDEGCRECLEIRVEKRMTGREVLETLDELIQEYGNPEYIRMDNGSEFISKELRKWMYDHGIQPVYIEPGSPWQNGYIESFNGKFRDECLNQEIFLSKTEAQVVVDWWRQVYNSERPHQSLKGRTPSEARLMWSTAD